MKKIDFTNYIDKFYQTKFYILLFSMWIVIGIMTYVGMKMFYLVFISILITIAGLSLFTQRLKTCYRGRFKELCLQDDNLILTFWGNKKIEKYSLSKIKKVYLTEISRKGKKFNPYHFFLTIGFSQKNVISSIEIPSEKIFEFLDHFNEFIESNNLEFKLAETDKIQKLLGKDIYEYHLKNYENNKIHL